MTTQAKSFQVTWDQFHRDCKAMADVDVDVDTANAICTEMQRDCYTLSGPQ